MIDKIIEIFEKMKKSIQEFAQEKYNDQVEKLNNIEALSLEDAEKLSIWLNTHQFYFSPSEFDEYSSNLDRKIRDRQEVGTKNI